MYSHITTRSEKSRLHRDLTTLNSKLEFEDASHGDCPPGDRRERGVVSVDLKGPSKFAEKKWCTQTRSSINALPAVDFRWISDPEVKDDAPQWCKEYNRNIVISCWAQVFPIGPISRSESKNPHVSRHRDFGKLRVGKGSFMWEVILIFWRQDSQPQLRVFENSIWLIFWPDGTRCTSINGSCGTGIDPTNNVELCHVRQVPNSWHQLKGKWQRGVLDLHVSIWVFKAAADHKVWKICWWSSQKKADTSPGTSTWLAQTGWEVASRVGMLIFTIFTQAPVALGWNSDATVSLPGQGWLYGLLPTSLTKQGCH